MKEHYCPVEKTVISYEGECNWCGEKEMNPIEIRELTKQEREHYTYCPCCKSRLKPMTAEEIASNYIAGMKLEEERKKNVQET